MAVADRSSSKSLGNASGCAQLAGKVPDSCVKLRFRVFSCWKAVGWDQLAGRLPARPLADRVSDLRTGKLVLVAHASGKLGTLPVRVRLVRECRHPKDSHDSTVRFAGALVLME